MALVCLALSLTSCTNRMVRTKDGLTHKKTGISYSTVLNMNYQPVGYDSEDPYTVWKYNDQKIDYCAIQGLEPTEWLYCPLFGEILTSTDTELPELSGFEANVAYICIEDSIAYTIHEIKDADKIAQIIERYYDESAPSYSTLITTDNYSIKFASEKYPAFYYSLKLVVDEDGVYIHDLAAGKYIDMGLLFDEYELYNSGYPDDDYEG